MHSTVQKFIQNLTVPVSILSLCYCTDGFRPSFYFFFRVIYNLTLAFTTFTFSVY